jgi:hypothetical protein
VSGHFQLLQMVNKCQGFEPSGKSLLQHATAVDQDLTGVCEFTSRGPPYPDLPLALFFVPRSSDNSMLKLHVLKQIMIDGHLLEIRPDFGRLRIIVRPIWIARPGELVRSRRNVARTSWVSGAQSALNRGRLGILDLFSSHVPPTSLFFSYICNSTFCNRCSANLEKQIPDAPPPI